MEHLRTEGQGIVRTLPRFVFVFSSGFFVASILVTSSAILLRPMRMLGKTSKHSVCGPRMDSLFVHGVRRYLGRKQLGRVRCPLSTRSNERCFRTHVTPFRSGGILTLVRSVKRQIRRTRRLVRTGEGTRRTSHVGSIFLTGVDRRVHAPLGTVINFTRVVTLARTRRRGRRCVNVVQGGDGILLRLVGSVLSLSHVRSNGSRVRFRLIRVASLVSRIRGMRQLGVESRVRLEMAHPRRGV